MKKATVYISQSQPLGVQEIEDQPSRSVISFSGRSILLRRARTFSGIDSWIPEDMIVRVEPAKSDPRDPE